MITIKIKIIWLLIKRKLYGFKLKIMFKRNTMYNKKIFKIAYLYNKKTQWNTLQVRSYTHTRF